jgi:hypothetical protein
MQDPLDDTCVPVLQEVLPLLYAVLNFPTKIKDLSKEDVDKCVTAIRNENELLQSGSGLAGDRDALCRMCSVQEYNKVIESKIRTVKISNSNGKIQVSACLMNGVARMFEPDTAQCSEPSCLLKNMCHFAGHFAHVGNTKMKNLMDFSSDVDFLFPFFLSDWKSGEPNKVEFCSLRDLVLENIAKDPKMASTEAGRTVQQNLLMELPKNPEDEHEDSDEEIQEGCSEELKHVVKLQVESALAQRALPQQGSHPAVPQQISKLGTSLRQIHSKLSEMGVKKKLIGQLKQQFWECFMACTDWGRMDDFLAEWPGASSIPSSIILLIDYVHTNLMLPVGTCHQWVQDFTTSPHRETPSHAAFFQLLRRPGLSERMRYACQAIAENVIYDKLDGTKRLSKYAEFFRRFFEPEHTEPPCIFTMLFAEDEETIEAFMITQMVFEGDGVLDTCLANRSIVDVGQLCTPTVSIEFVYKRKTHGTPPTNAFPALWHQFSTQYSVKRVLLIAIAKNFWKHQRDAGQVEELIGQLSKHPHHSMYMKDSTKLTTEQAIEKAKEHWPSDHAAAATAGGASAPPPQPQPAELFRDISIQDMNHFCAMRCGCTDSRSFTHQMKHKKSRIRCMHLHDIFFQQYTYQILELCESTFSKMRPFVDNLIKSNKKQRVKI